MNKRQKSIISLLKTNKWLTGKELAKLLGVTDRTIRNDIKNINLIKNDELIISSRKLGYSLKSEEIFDAQQKNFDQNREKYILKELLNNKDSISYSHLIDTLFVSDASINQAIANLNKKIGKYNGLTIKRNKDRLYLDGDELSIRLLYKEALYIESQDNIFNLDVLAAYYDKFNLLELKTWLEEILEKHKYKINIYSYPMLILHLGIIVDRVISDKGLTKIDIEADIDDNALERLISEELFSIISDKLEINIPKTEIELFSYILLSKSRNSKIIKIKEDKVFTSIEKLLVHLDELLGINFINDKVLKQDLYLHIKALIERSHFNNTIENLYLKELMRENPFIYELAVFSANFLEQSLGIKINKDEIPFLAIHLGTAYKRIYTNKFRAVLIMPNTKSLSYQMYERIENVFSDDLQIVGIYNYFEEETINGMDVDLIISSIPIYHSLEIPTVNCSLFFNNKDEVMIFKAIKNLEDKKLERSFSNHLEDLFSREFFFANQNFNSNEEILKFLSNKLYRNSYVEKDYYDKVIIRESYSPTSFSNSMAIPHSIDTDSIKRSIISVVILDKPVKWGEYDVKIIFLLTIKNYNNQALKLFFTWMENMTSDAKKFSKLIGCKNFDSFMETFNKIT